MLAFDVTHYTGWDMDGAGSVTSPSSQASKGPRTADGSPVFPAAWELCSHGPWSAGNSVRNLQNSECSGWYSTYLALPQHHCCYLPAHWKSESLNLVLLSFRGSPHLFQGFKDHIPLFLMEDMIAYVFIEIPLTLMFWLPKKAICIPPSSSVFLHSILFYWWLNNKKIKNMT